jgi:hypothetical protein
MAHDVTRSGSAVQRGAAPRLRRGGARSKLPWLAISLQVSATRLRLAALAALTVPAALACGPSFQAVYECDVRFAHCYALDDREVSFDAKRDCWRTWLHGYTYGQSRDRVEYASARFSQLSFGPVASNADGGDPPAPAVASPVPTNAFAPPPSLAASGAPADGGPTLALREVSLRAPGADCCEGCTRRWSSCRDGCKEHGCDECDQSYRACMPRCFHEDSGNGSPARALH